jgi:pantoate--beta-alanine ligase
MGALHKGHVSLIRKARRLAGRRGAVAVSIFVNPTQFGPHEDFKKYPRPFARDCEICRRAGVDAVFAPNARAMYAADASAFVDESRLSKGLCGASRPGHFRGVCTIVAKLFNILAPDAAIFGLKDYQQARVIQRMARDLNFPVRIVTAPIVREPDGLALSSRNAYLTATEHARATAIRRALLAARRKVRAGRIPSAFLRAGIRRDLRGLQIDYIEVIDPRSLEPQQHARRGNCVAVAAFLDRVRLIDNIIL